MNQNEPNKVFQVRRPGKIEPIYLSNKLLTRKRILDLFCRREPSWFPTGVCIKEAGIQLRDEIGQQSLSFPNKPIQCIMYRCIILLLTHSLACGWSWDAWGTWGSRISWLTYPTPVSLDALWKLSKIWKRKPDNLESQYCLEEEKETSFDG